jgi:hypothetical protein
MAKYNIKMLFVLIVLISIVICINIYAEGSSDAFKMYKKESISQSAISIGKTIGLETWPKSNILRSFPKIDKSLLANPDLVTREHIEYNSDLFIDNTKGVSCTYYWERLIDNPSPPTELPADAKDSLLEHIPANIKSDPNLLNEYLKQNYERYKKSKSKIVSGQLRIDICVAPDSQAANEYIIMCTTGTTLPKEITELRLSLNNRLEGLGTIAFLSPIMFVRDSIAVIIDARGELTSEALPLAKKIDALILKQPALTAQQIQARRPIISISSNVEKDTDENKTIAFKVTLSEGQEIIDIKAYVDGNIAAIKNGKILIQGDIKTKQVTKVKIVAITSELLVNAQELEVPLPQ